MSGPEQAIEFLQEQIERLNQSRMTVTDDLIRANDMLTMVRKRESVRARYTVALTRRAEKAESQVVEVMVRLTDAHEEITALRNALRGMLDYSERMVTKDLARAAVSLRMIEETDYSDQFLEDAENMGPWGSVAQTYGDWLVAAVTPAPEEGCVVEKH